MTILAIFQALISLPSTLNAIWDKINALEAGLKAAEKAAASAAISKAQADTESAETIDQMKQAAAEAADAIRKL